MFLRASRRGCQLREWSSDAESSLHYILFACYLQIRRNAAVKSFFRSPARSDALQSPPWGDVKPSGLDRGVYTYLTYTILYYTNLSYPILTWVVKWLSVGCQLVDTWLTNGCRLVVIWYIYVLLNCSYQPDKGRGGPTAPTIYTPTAHINRTAFTSTAQFNRTNPLSRLRRQLP